MLEQRVILENKADAPILHGQIGGVPVVEIDVTAIGRVQTGDDAKQRRLSRARRSEQRHQFARLNVERDVAQRSKGAEVLFDALDADRETALAARQRRLPRAASASA